MNIKITRQEHEFLLSKQHGEKQILGSRLYGTHKEDSDFDYMCLYKASLYDPGGLPGIHQFQYDDEENNTDYIWTSETQFAKNLLSGDSTINADIILFGEAKSLGEDISLEERVEICRTYKIIKAFLGFSKRDIKYAREGIHKLFHAHRGLYTAQCLVENGMPSLACIQSIYKQDVENVTAYRTQLSTWEKDLRNRVNKMYEDHELEMYFLPSLLEERGPYETLANKFIKSNNTREFRYE